MKLNQPHLNRLQQLLSILIFSSGISACGGDNSTENDNLNDATPTDTTPTVLEGTWFKGCGIGLGENSSDPDAFYDEITLTFTGNKAESLINNFADASCTIPYFISPEVTAKGVFSIGDQFITDSGLTARQIDDHVTEYQGALFDINTYGLFYIDPTDSNRLLFGDDNGTLDGLSPATRPTALNFDRIYIKQ